MENSVSRKSKLVRFSLWVLAVLAGLAAVWLVFDSYRFMQSLPDRGLNIRVARLVGLVVLNLFFTGVLACIGLLFLWVRVASSLPELRGWHTQKPDSEFVASDAKAGYGLDDYLAQETRVFDELNALVTGPWAKQHSGAFNRFHANSVCNPENILDQNWNRSFVLKNSNPVGAVLLLHGLSDSPYSLRALGKRLHSEGYTVVWLRLPGHGTCPRALADVSRSDWAAAVTVAMKGLQDLVPAGTPLLLGGYSNGGALSVNYTLDSINDRSLPKVAAVVLFSPMIGINPMAKLTRLYHTVGLVSSNPKAQWSSVEAEIDPFKYSSWPMNANVQAWAMTQAVELKLAELQRSGRMNEMPPVLAMQSVVDSTVVVSKLITVLFDRLVSDLSELMLFDVNRVDWFANLLNFSFERAVITKLKRTDLPYRLSLLKNVSTDSQQVVIGTRDGASWSQQSTELSWPERVVSLSHIAVPIPPDDPLYGSTESAAVKGLSLGTLSVRAEPSALLISDSLFVRCRNNPFYSLMEDRVVTWLAKSIQAAGERPERAE